MTLTVPWPINFPFTEIPFKFLTFEKYEFFTPSNSNEHILSNAVYLKIVSKLAAVRLRKNIPFHVKHILDTCKTLDNIS